MFPLLLARDLGFDYPGVPVLQGLSFAIRPGLALVIGGDGRGKTTLLRLLAGECLPTAGSLERRPGLVFFTDPRDPQDDPLPARDWLARQRALHPRWDEASESRLLQGFALEAHLDKQLLMLSTGTRRKLWLTAALACGADLVLLETPFSALDLPSRRLLAVALTTAAAGGRQAVVVADHETPEYLAASPVAVRIALGD